MELERRTAKPAGKLLFQVTGAFCEFEHSMIRQRLNASLNVIKVKMLRDGRFTTKGSIVRRRPGRPGAEPTRIERALQELAKRVGIGKVARRNWHRPQTEMGNGRLYVSDPRADASGARHRQIQ